MPHEEMLEVVDHAGNVLSVRPRSEVHGDPSLMHRVVHVLVFDAEGRLLLQKRSMSKDVAPGKWDTSVGGHVEPGEPLERAALREMREELGVSPKTEYLYSYVHSNPYETEQVHTYRAVHGDPVSFNRDEIDEVRGWTVDEIRAALDGPALSDNFKDEFHSYLRHIGL